MKKPPKKWLEVANLLLAGTMNSLDLTTTAGVRHHSLWAMEKEGLLRSWEGTELVPERGNRPRRFYALTPEGRHWLGSAP